MKLRWDGVWFGNLNGTRTSGGRHGVQDKSSLMEQGQVFDWFSRQKSHPNSHIHNVR